MSASVAYAPSGLASLRVLVVDDQEHVRRWVRRVLRQLGVERITEAEDGRSGLSFLTAPGAAYDVVLCDLKMPKGDGIELVRALAALGIQTAIVLVSMESARVLETSGLLAEEQGLRILGTIPKPVTTEKLEPILYKVLEGQGSPPAEAPGLARDTIRQVLTSGALHLVYQPKIVMATGQFAGVEALARWNHPEYGAISPDVFVAVCEESDSLGRWLLDFTLEEAMAFSVRWREGGSDLNIALNVHARAFDQVDLPERVEALARRHGVPPQYITLEITERSVAKDAVRMLDVATRLRLKGFGLAIDDFGTGHSGLAQLRRLPFNELKIDRQFVHGAAESATKRSVVEASVALARNLEMTSVAEGIQQRPEWDLLQSLGCEEMQGYFTARPMTEHALYAWAAQWNLTRSFTGSGVIAGAGR
ncbi:MAG: EAL domain-containing response regulator [Gemmatimonadetes bacterium]|nr:EAL domain-containing response regulator [Gemmatimonadota bacterium]